MGITNGNEKDKPDIIDRRNVLCGQINVLCYFSKCQSVIKQKLLFAYCYRPSLYGGVLWDLSNRFVDSVCVAWRKGLRRVRNLPSDTHSVLLPVLSNTLPVIDELAKRFVAFIQRWNFHGIPWSFHVFPMWHEIPSSFLHGIPWSLHEKIPRFPQCVNSMGYPHSVGSTFE